jgi:hypothetical protein
MQRTFYGVPKDPVLDDARTLYRWVRGSRPESESVQAIKDGPRLLIVGRASP